MDTECVAFLQWALPRLGFRWAGYRKVRTQVCKRIMRRCRELGLTDMADYREFLLEHDDEWPVLDSLCRITISRFYRDVAIFDRLTDTVMPALARDAQHRGAKAMRVWSIGCASGEETYTLALAWQFAVRAAVRGIDLRVLGTDVGPAVLERARAACYSAGSLRQLPESWRTAAFELRGTRWCLRSEFHAGIEFRDEDIRQPDSHEPFDLILCRNLVFTYFETPAQIIALEAISKRLRPGGALVLGAHESLPPDSRYTPWPEIRVRGIYVFGVKE